jgi:hypothetical protein
MPSIQNQRLTAVEAARADEKIMLRLKPLYRGRNRVYLGHTAVDRLAQPIAEAASSSRFNLARSSALGAGGGPAEPA